MGAEIGFLVSPAVLIIAVTFALAVATGLAARIWLLLEDLIQRQFLTDKPVCRKDRRGSAPAIPALMRCG